MQATVLKTNRQIELISDPAQVEAAENGDLKIGDKNVLVVKGGCTASVTGEVYLAFARNLDSQGKPFVFSRRFRSLAHEDPVWRRPKKVSAVEFEQFLGNWFCFAEKVTNSDGPALILTDKLPKFFCALMMQSRYAAQFAEDFRWID
jgi:hypothetical protein